MSWFCCQRTNPKQTEAECELQQSKDKAILYSKFTATNDQHTRRSAKSNSNKTNDALHLFPNSKETPNESSINLHKDTNQHNTNNSNKCSIYEDYHNHPSPAIQYLHSDLIENHYYIGQQISNSLIQQYDLVSLFKEKQITLIVNLQLPFESQKCQMTQGILDQYSGHAFTPPIFSSQGICVLQFGFKEGSTPESFDFLLHILREIANTVQIEQKKVYLHSHYGLERTTLIMVCYKIFTENSTTESVYQSMKKQRPGSYLSEEQFAFCKSFEQKAMKTNKLFHPMKLDLTTYLKHQIELTIYPLSLNLENNALFIPKIVRVCLSRILILQKKLNLTKPEIYNTMNGSFEISANTLNTINEAISRLTASDYSPIEESENIMVITEVLYNWLNKSVEYLIEPSKIAQLFQVKIDNETVDTLIGKDIVSLSEIKMKEIQSIIFNSLNKEEYEILKYVSWFISHLLPAIVEETKAYEKMIERLSIYLIGYEPEMLIIDKNKQNNQYYLNYRKVIGQTSSLLKLFISLEVFNEKNDMMHKSYLPFGTNMLYLNNTGLGESDKESLGNGNCNGHGQSASVSGMSANEYKLYELYSSLKKRFEPTELKTQGSKKSISGSKLKKKKVIRNKTTNVTFANSNVIYKG